MRRSALRRGDMPGVACTDDTPCARRRVFAPRNPTQANQCSNGSAFRTRDATNPRDGRCQNAPNDNLCSIDRFRAA